MPDLWFGPDVASDILALVGRPEDWADARSKVSAVQFYAQHALSNHLNEMGVGPNCYPLLREGGIWSWLAEQCIPVTLEAGAVKPWSPDGRQGLDGILTCLDRIRKAGADVSAVVLDEPLGSSLSTNWEPSVVASTCYVIDGVRAAGVQQMGLVEPYPYVSAPHLIRFMEEVQQAGSSPSFLHLDVDRYAIRDRHMPADQVANDLKWLQGQCRAWLIPFGVVIWGQRCQTETEYRISAMAWAAQVRRYLGGWPDRLIVQSWEVAPDGTLTLPMNLPESDPTKHAAIVRDVANLAAQG